ncbi:MAG TPA: hypothetical protein VMJ10_36495 [Kofleriaceae bacterium]|nr:hypothetical protein [Kofleriaceae bacterium]
MKRLLFALVVACSSPPRTTPSRVDLGAGAAEPDQVRRKRLVAELQDEILSSYDRDDLPDIETSRIPAIVGPARIGVGPGDVLYGDDVGQRASSRWPLYLGNDVQTEVRSKHLDIHLSADKQVSAAWMSDEVSWRIRLCGRIAVIPLRITALYAHDGDRWVEVFEHLSWGRVPIPYFAPGPDGKPQNQLRGIRFAPSVVDRKLADELSRRIFDLFSREPQRLAGVLSLDPDRRAEDDPSLPAPTLLLAPDPDGEWHGDQQITHVQLVDGTLRPEDRRIGTVGTSPATATIAYWVGNFVADLAMRPGVEAGTKVLLRGTFVFEKRGGNWIIVQGHLSEPIDDLDLASDVFGSSLEMSDQDFLRKRPLAVSCDDGRRSAATVPAPASAPANPAPGAPTASPATPTGSR